MGEEKQQREKEKQIPFNWTVYSMFDLFNSSVRSFNPAQRTEYDGDTM